MNKSTGELCAVKRQEANGVKDGQQKLLRELDMSKGLQHKNVVVLLGHVLQGDHIYTLMELVAGGSMKQLLEEFGPLSEKTLKMSTEGLLSGLDYLHTSKPPVIHRDIKCANLLVELDMTVKLADFGCAKRDMLCESYTTIGSIPWMAPEVIKSESAYGRSADIWSVGCTIIEMATAAAPWGKAAFDNVWTAMYLISMSEEAPPISDSIPEQARDLIRMCLQRSPESRPQAYELLEHEFLAGDSRDSACSSSRDMISFSSNNY
ncbi:unnamed protein product [Polarella glacialis]|uniref:Protein kinase domain-containing protein n=1 Tax=Polarella glacialis TaxID=89957 RepID=A0A813GNC1_POLGL|nr:unnamed protein product [Polarella glacialis]